MCLEGKPETEQQPVFSYAFAILWQDKFRGQHVTAHRAVVKNSQTQAAKLKQDMCGHCSKNHKLSFKQDMRTLMLVHKPILNKDSASPRT